MQIRATTRYRNDRMLRRRKELGLSQPKYAEFLGVSFGYLGPIERLNLQGTPVTPGFLEAVRSIADDLECDAQDIWPDWLTALKVVDDVRTAKMSETVLEAALYRSQRQLEWAKPPDELLSAGVRYGGVWAVVTQHVTARQLGVLQARLADPPETFVDIGERLGLTGESIRRILLNTLRRLREPWIIKRIRSVLKAAGGEVEHQWAQAVGRGAEGLDL